MFWMDWRELEKHNDWGVRDKDDASAALWNGGAEQWEKRSAQELDFAQRQVDALDRITPETTVLDTLLAMTKAQGGSAVVVNPDGTLAGIFTDGDFRRRITAAGELKLTTPVAAVMTAKPLFIRDDAYAVDLLKVFERRRIDDLPVCDAAGRVLGVVDIQDLPKMKVL